MEPNVNSKGSIIRKGKRKELKLDYAKLHEELEAELESNKRYWIENEAKIRAVHNSRTYEDFRQIVLAAHLTPLDKKDKETLGPEASMHNRVVWNNLSLKSSDTKDLTLATSCQRQTCMTQGQPTRVEEFSRDWKKLEADPEAKLTYLRTLLHSDDDIAVESSPCPSKGGVLKRIFRYEVPVDILPNILEIFHLQFIDNAVDVQSALDVLKVLQIIAESKRFAFTQIFLTSIDRERLKSIFLKTKALLLAQLKIPKNGIDEHDGDESDEFPNQLIILFNTVKTKYSKLTD